eukprot:1159914-Pelagomonas_calceolata.AAC.3
MIAQGHLCTQDGVPWDGHHKIAWNTGLHKILISMWLANEVMDLATQSAQVTTKFCGMQASVKFYSICGLLHKAMDLASQSGHHSGHRTVL